MQAEYMGVGTVSDGKALQDILTPLRYECPEIDFKRNIALLLCCGNSSCVRMTLNYLSVVKGKCDGAVCTYEFREKASRDRKTFTVVIIPKEAVGEGRPK